MASTLKMSKLSIKEHLHDNQDFTNVHRYTSQAQFWYSIWQLDTQFSIVKGLVSEDPDPEHFTNKVWQDHMWKRN